VYVLLNKRESIWVLSSYHFDPMDEVVGTPHRTGRELLSPATSAAAIIRIAMMFLVRMRTPKVSTSSPSTPYCVLSD